MVQKETEMNYYRTMFERINQEEKNKTLQQFYDKKVFYF